MTLVASARRAAFLLLLCAPAFADTGSPVAADTSPLAVLGDDAPLIEPSRGAGLSRLLREPRLPPGADFARTDTYLDTLPAASGDAEWQCLSEALYFEARGESAEGLFAVAEVILNRRDSGLYPATVCAVVSQGTGRRYQCQFSYACDGASDAIHEPEAFVRVGKVARLMLDDAPRDLTGGALFYHTKSVSPYWSHRFDHSATIGAHLFYTSG
ncbi:cell wall hydrolase [Oceaniovalibus guishaninsula]|nr:cell wall hydrolase [Oceaniovalibus guishaninsula]